MKILVCGGRNFKDYRLLSREIHKLLPEPTDDISTWLPPNGTVIIHGGATGADYLADKWAVANWVPIKEYKADWDKHGKAAGPIRNQQMLDEEHPDVVLAFPTKRSKGTWDMVRRAKKAQIRTIVIGP